MSVLDAPGRGPAASLVALRTGGRCLVIPLGAMPYVGRGLDLSMFDLASLRHAERDGRLPLTLRYHGRPHVVPGITVTHAAPGVARGYLTRASAAEFSARTLDRLLHEGGEV